MTAAVQISAEDVLAALARADDALLRSAVVTSTSPAATRQALADARARRPATGARVDLARVRALPDPAMAETEELIAYAEDRATYCGAFHRTHDERAFRALAARLREIQAALDEAKPRSKPDVRGAPT